MGLLVEGVWQDKWYDTKSTGGKFVRSNSQFLNWITPNGEVGPTGEIGYPAERDRYHLYVSNACPWAHRTLIARKLKGLEDIISISVVHPHMGENGWSFEKGEGVIPDPIIGAKYLREIYTLHDPKYTGRVTVPVLFDKKTNKIVCNESATIIRIFNTAFEDMVPGKINLLPSDLEEDIDKLNEIVYENVNNGVYKAGFATAQGVYEEEVKNLFNTLDMLEDRLKDRKFLFGDELNEADIRLFTTLVRFDSVYYSHFKCNIRRLIDYKNLWRYTREVYNYDGISETVNLSHVKEHYFTSHPTINPNGIVPVGPELDFSL